MSSHGRAKSGDQWPSREIIGAKLLQNAEKGTKMYSKELHSSLKNLTYEINLDFFRWSWDVLIAMLLDLLTPQSSPSL